MKDEAFGAANSHAVGGKLTVEFDDMTIDTALDSDVIGVRPIIAGVVARPCETAAPADDAAVVND